MDGCNWCGKNTFERRDDWKNLFQKKYSILEKTTSLQVTSGKDGGVKKNVWLLVLH